MNSKGQSGFSSGFGWSQGSVAVQPHVKIPEGTYEEEHARRGFFGRTSHLYHRHPPTGWTRIEGDLKPRAYYATKLAEEAGKAGKAGKVEENETLGRPTVLLANADVEIGIARLTGEMAVYARNGDGDEVRFIHEGSGILETDYGDLDFRAGDYLVIPRGVTYRFIAATPNVQLVIESAGEIELPERGMLGRHAQFDPMVMRVPMISPEEKKTGSKKGPDGSPEWEMRIKREGAWTKVFYPFNPINASGWKGDLAPWAIHVDEIRPIVSPRFHLPPSVHTTFVGRNFVICSFLPRPLENEEGAMKVPFYHRNIDFDEVIFYHAGNFFSREGISAGSVTWHPQGIHHGPHPNAAANAANKDYTHEIAVMIDTRYPLRPADAAEAVEFREYHMSWRADQKR